MSTCTENRGHEWVTMRRLAAFDCSTILGAPFPVILLDAVDEKYCGKCNEVLGHVVPNPKSLFAVVAVLRAMDATKLSGSEIRFLRKSLSRKAKELAEEIALSPEQLSRFENDKQPISEVYERLLRAAVCLGHFDATSNLGVDAKHLFSMKIPSVRDCKKEVKFELSFGVAPRIEPETDGSDNCTYKVA